MRTLTASITCASLSTLLSVASARADVVELRGGGRVTGVLVQQTSQLVVVDAGPGRVTLPMSRVERIVRGRSALQAWQERASTLSPRDAQGWAALARWAEDAGLETQAREAWQRVVAVSPTNADANAALRRVQLNGQWVSEEEAYRGRGYVYFEGRWVSPSEHEARVRELAAADAEQQERREAALRMREAEARAREAEARARDAERMGTGPGDEGGVPLGWYGYGGGIIGGYPYIDPYGAAEPMPPQPAVIPVYPPPSTPRTSINSRQPHGNRPGNRGNTGHNGRNNRPGNNPGHGGGTLPAPPPPGSSGRR